MARSAAMQFERKTTAVMIALVLAASVLFQPRSVRAEPTRTIEVSIAGGEVEGESTLRVVSGESIEILFRADTDLELHLHGYDIQTQLRANVPASMTFVARIEGRFPIAAHGHAHGAGSHRPLLYLEVHPR